MENRSPQRTSAMTTSKSLLPRSSIKTGPSPINRNHFNQGAFLLKKTEISVESEVVESLSNGRFSDQASISSSRDEKRGRSIFGKSNDSQCDDRSSIHSGAWRSSEDLAKNFDSLSFGTTVSIEAAPAVKACEQRLHEMRGLEQAASMKRWAGDGKPAEAWGKLSKDPELWDETGDALVYFGYQRPQASFRIRVSLLEDTKSEFLISKLQQGFQRSARLSPSRNNTSTLRGELKHLSLAANRHRALPTLSEHGDPRKESPIRHEIHFPAPENASRTELLRHHITTRNLFAFLLSKPLVGLTYYQALTDLHERLMLYMPKVVDCAQLMIQYLNRNHLQNVTNDPAAAAGLFAWIENGNIAWQEGWREAFVHCVGMYHDMRNLSEARDIRHTSWELVKRSNLELQARIEACESRLSTFNFDDIWHPSASLSPLSHRSFDNMRHFLRQYYEKMHKGWPPAAAHGNNDHWLTRELVRRLQNDFGSLYDYYVDRTRPWDQTAELQAPESKNATGMDGNDNLTKLFRSFDTKYGYPTIPYPYPLQPASAADLFESKPLKQNILSTKSRAIEKRTIHACAEASNSLLVGVETATNSLVEAFLRFEKADLVKEANPREVRQGRWILLYGVLQVLATMSVDTPGLWYKDAPYFLNPRFKGNLSEAETSLEEANPTLSYCWTVPRTWKREDSTT